jgi:DNA-binding transcriptional regulator GbsR (MarR family)
MLQKVHEAVASFRKVADQQMAETTKRAINENQSITAQLQKMSNKVIELIAENDKLLDQMRALKTENKILKDSEKGLAKRNIANQRMVQSLVKKVNGTGIRILMCGRNGQNVRNSV